MRTTSFFCYSWFCSKHGWTALCIYFKFYGYLWDGRKNLSISGTFLLKTPFSIWKTPKCPCINLCEESKIYPLRMDFFVSGLCFEMGLSFLPPDLLLKANSCSWMLLTFANNFSCWSGSWCLPYLQIWGLLSCCRSLLAFFESLVVIPWKANKEPHWSFMRAR